MEFEETSRLIKAYVVFMFLYWTQHVGDSIRNRISFSQTCQRTHAVVDVRKQILEFNTAGSRLGLFRVERSWQMRMHRTKNPYCVWLLRAKVCSSVVLSFIAWIASRDVQVCWTCLVVLETSQNVACVRISRSSRHIPQDKWLSNNTGVRFLI